MIIKDRDCGPQRISLDTVFWYLKTKSYIDAGHGYNEKLRVPLPEIYINYWATPPLIKDQPAATSSVIIRRR